MAGKRSTCKSPVDVCRDLKLLASQDDGLPGAYLDKWKDVCRYLVTNRLDYFLRDWRMLEGRIGGRGELQEWYISTFPVTRADISAKYALSVVNIYFIWWEDGNEERPATSTIWSLVGANILPVKKGRCGSRPVGYISSLSRKIASSSPHGQEKSEVLWRPMLMDTGLIQGETGKYLNEQGNRELERMVQKKGFYLDSAAERFLAGDPGRQTLMF